MKQSLYLCKSASNTITTSTYPYTIMMEHFNKSLFSKKKKTIIIKQLNWASVSYYLSLPQTTYVTIHVNLKIDYTYYYVICYYL